MLPIFLSLLLAALQVVGGTSVPSRRYTSECSLAGVTPASGNVGASDSGTQIGVCKTLAQEAGIASLYSAIISIKFCDNNCKNLAPGVFTVPNNETFCYNTGSSTECSDPQLSVSLWKTKSTYVSTGCLANVTAIAPTNTLFYSGSVLYYYMKGGNVGWCGTPYGYPGAYTGEGCTPTNTVTGQPQDISHTVVCIGITRVENCASVSCSQGQKNSNATCVTGSIDIPCDEGYCCRSGGSTPSSTCQTWFEGNNNCGTGFVPDYSKNSSTCPNGDCSTFCCKPVECTQDTDCSTKYSEFCLPACKSWSCNSERTCVLANAAVDTQCVDTSLGVNFVSTGCATGLCDAFGSCNITGNNNKLCSPLSLPTGSSDCQVAVCNITATTASCDYANTNEGRECEGATSQCHKNTCQSGHCLTNITENAQCTISSPQDPACSVGTCTATGECSALPVTCGTADLCIESSTCQYTNGTCVPTYKQENTICGATTSPCKPYQTCQKNEYDVLTCTPATLANGTRCALTNPTSSDCASGHCEAGTCEAYQDSCNLPNLGFCQQPQCHINGTCIAVPANEGQSCSSNPCDPAVCNQGVCNHTHTVSEGDSCKPSDLCGFKEDKCSPYVCQNISAVEPLQCIQKPKVCPSGGCATYTCDSTTGNCTVAGRNDTFCKDRSLGLCGSTCSAQCDFNNKTAPCDPTGNGCTIGNVCATCGTAWAKANCTAGDSTCSATCFRSNLLVNNFNYTVAKWGWTNGLYLNGSVSNIYYQTAELFNGAGNGDCGTSSARKVGTAVLAATVTPGTGTTSSVTASITITATSDASIDLTDMISISMATGYKDGQPWPMSTNPTLAPGKMPLRCSVTDAKTTTCTWNSAKYPLTITKATPTSASSNTLYWMLHENGCCAYCS